MKYRSTLALLALHSVLASQAMAQPYYNDYPVTAGFSGFYLTATDSTDMHWTGSFSGLFETSTTSGTIPNTLFTQYAMFFKDAATGDVADMQWSNTDQDFQGTLDNANVVAYVTITGGAYYGSYQLGNILEMPGSNQSFVDYENSINGTESFGSIDTLDPTDVLPCAFTGPIGGFQTYSGLTFSYDIYFGTPIQELDSQMWVENAGQVPGSVPGPVGAGVFGLGLLARRRAKAGKSAGLRSCSPFTPDPGPRAHGWYAPG